MWVVATPLVSQLRCGRVRMFRVARSVGQMRSEVQRLRTEGTHRMGFVPTMGALHEGHLSLMRQAREECDSVAVSVFVNPTQFAPGEDFDSYPSTLEADLDAMGMGGDAPLADVVFAPSGREMYPHMPPGASDPAAASSGGTFVETMGVSSGLEAGSRPHFFRGVCTVVAKLLAVVTPDVMYLGQKDAQQLAVLKKMVADLLLPVRVVGVPTVRAENGLALSSRNAYLSHDEREQAGFLYRALTAAAEAHARHPESVTPESIVESITRAASSVPSADLDYVAVSHPLTLDHLPSHLPFDSALVSLACFYGSKRTRLIDNITL